jgi:hypothetical protein
MVMLRIARIDTPVVSMQTGCGNWTQYRCPERVGLLAEGSSDMVLLTTVS